MPYKGFEKVFGESGKYTLLFKNVGEFRVGDGEEQAIFDFDQTGVLFQVELLHLETLWPKFRQSCLAESQSKKALLVSFELHLVFLRVHDSPVRKFEGTAASVYSILYNSEGEEVGLQFFDFAQPTSPIARLNLFNCMPL